MNELREAAQRAVDAVALRFMAEQVGMPETRLHDYLAGTAEKPPIATEG